jgi:hypothetical protein
LILLDVDVLVGLEDANLVIGELNTIAHRESASRDRSERIREVPYVKPLIKVNSCLISPPSAFALSLAFVSSSGEAFSLSVTFGMTVST